MQTNETVERDGVRLAVRIWEGGGPGLLLIHGLASTSHIFDLIAPLLAPEFSVVAYDQRGHGESAKPPVGYGFASVAADALAVIEATGLERPVVLGHSWGANVALECGVRWPQAIAGTILVDGGVVAIRRWVDWPSARSHMAPPHFAGARLSEFLDRSRSHLRRVRATPELELVARSLVRISKDGTVRPKLAHRNHMSILRAMWEQDPIALLRQVAGPTLVVAVREDGPGLDGPLAGAKEAAVRAARSIGGHVRVEWIHGIHDVPLQRPRAMANRIRSFVRSVAGTAEG